MGNHVVCNPDLTINGTGIAARNSAKLRHTESFNNPDPQNISIVERPASRSGRAFDITFSPDTANKKKVPTQLARLERHRKQKHEFTREELEEKLRKAEERRQVRSHMTIGLLYQCLFSIGGVSVGM